MFSLMTSNLIWKEGLRLVVTIICVALLGVIFFMPLFFIALGLFVFCFYFFRNPDRRCSQAKNDDTIIVCPADGRVVDVSPHKVSIFMSPLNVHVNWIPISGIVETIEYVPGKFMMAFLPKSSELNEHNDVHIRHKNGTKIIVRQIAGTVARRIVCWLKQNEKVTAGQKYGMIKFSSRVDIIVPNQTKINVIIGQSVIGGQTIIGRLT